MQWHGNLLYVQDLDASVEFYHGALSLPLLDRPAPHLAIVGLGNGVLYLHADPDDAREWFDQALRSGQRGIGVIVHIEVPDVDAVKQALEAKGVDISSGPVDTHGQRQLYVYDPSGYNLVFVQSLGD